MQTTLANIFAKPVVKFYKRQIVKDPFHLAIRQWKRDQGNKRLRYEYPLGEESVVLDVGGYEGAFADAITHRYHSQVHVFEPMPHFYRRCTTRFLNQPNVRVFEYGLGNADEVLRLSDSADASSFHVARDGATMIEARIRDIASVWDELGLDEVDLIKINIEGGEYPLLNRLIETGLVARIKHIQVQFHDFIEDANQQRDSIRAGLADTHDESWCYSFVWESWQRKSA